MSASSASTNREIPCASWKRTTWGLSITLPDAMDNYKLMRAFTPAPTCLSDVRRLATFQDSILTAGPSSCLAGRIEALYTTAWHASAHALATLRWHVPLCIGIFCTHPSPPQSPQPLQT